MPEATSQHFTLSDKLKRRLFAIEDVIFAKRYKLNLGGVIAREDLEGADEESRSHATAYHGVWCRNLRELFNKAGKLRISFDNFVDIGSGKGKACFYASMKMDFKCVIGVEFSRPLVEISLENSRQFGRSNINFYHADARSYFLPPGDSLIFLFNPFDDLILQCFLRNNLDHFQKHRSVIAYANDIHKETLSLFGFEMIFRNPTRKISLYQLA
jgi:SAM-dependent methyltransferase